ncbi:MAG TPA: AtpZ/AtpI family protein [Candidatus Saccharimonadales bacterium]|nr:AtpZ/AtpI family protein [Candidatus Saccharimonadales bacterium]
MGTKNEEQRKSGTPTSLFFSMGLDMSWRLALSVLVPLVGGAELDKHFKTTPILLILGFLIAIGLSIVTIRRTLKLTNNITFITENKQRKSHE